MNTAVSEFRALHRLTWVVFLLAGLFFIFFDQSKHQAILLDINPFAEDPFDAVASFAVQLAPLAALLGLLRVYRPYPDARARPAAAILVVRANLTALSAILVALAADGAAMGRFTQVWIGSPAGWLLAGLVSGLFALAGLAAWRVARFGQALAPAPQPRRWGWAVVACLAGLSFLWIYPAALRMSVPGEIVTILAGICFLFVLTAVLAHTLAPSTDQPFEDVLDDLAAIFAWLQSRAGLDQRAGEWWRKRFANQGAAAFMFWLNPRRHPRAFALGLVALLSVGIGMGLLLLEGLSEGPPPASMTLILFGIYISMEAAALLLGCALFNRFLGIFRSEAK